MTNLSFYCTDAVTTPEGRFFRGRVVEVIGERVVGEAVSPPVTVGRGKNGCITARVSNGYFGRLEPEHADAAIQWAAGQLRKEERNAR